MASPGVQFPAGSAAAFLPYVHHRFQSKLQLAVQEREHEACTHVPCRRGSGSLFSGVGKGPTGVIKSILDTSRTDGKVREEIFVDIVEKISCTFSSSGALQNSQIDGAIQVGSPASIVYRQFAPA